MGAPFSLLHGKRKKNPTEITEIEMTSTSMSRFLTRVETKVLITEFDKKESSKKN